MRDDDQPNSPFRPGYGKQPLVFGGHSRLLSDLEHVFSTHDFGENHSLLISGLRGAGKTSMLGMMEEAGRAEGWLVFRDHASRGLIDRLMESLIPAVVNALSSTERTKLKSLTIGAVGAEFEHSDTSRVVKPLLRTDLITLANATDNRGILMLIDEVSSGKARLRELATLARELDAVIAAGVNLMVAFAGVKVDLNELLAQAHTTFLRRSNEVDFRRLSPTETQTVLRETVELGGRGITEDAVRALTAISQGYPYLVQLAGDYAWRNDPMAPEITLSDANAAHERAVRAIERRVISKMFLDLSSKDQEFLQAMSLDDGSSRVSDIERRMNVSKQYVQVYKQRLIDSGYVQSAGHGRVEFSLPYLGDYVRTTASEEVEATEDGWENFPPPAPPAAG